MIDKRNITIFLVGLFVLYSFGYSTTYTRSYEEVFAEYPVIPAEYIVMLDTASPVPETDPAGAIYRFTVSVANLFREEPIMVAEAWKNEWRLW